MQEVCKCCGSLGIARRADTFRSSRAPHVLRLDVFDSLSLFHVYQMERIRRLSDDR